MSECDCPSPQDAPCALCGALDSCLWRRHHRLGRLCNWCACRQRRLQLKSCSAPKTKRRRGQQQQPWCDGWVSDSPTRSTRPRATACSQPSYSCLGDGGPVRAGPLPAPAPCPLPSWAAPPARLAPLAVPPRAETWSAEPSCQLGNSPTTSSSLPASMRASILLLSSFNPEVMSRPVVVLPSCLGEPADIELPAALSGAGAAPHGWAPLPAWV